MGRIRGHYEWDDDDLTPGKKREGGLHQNLFDSDGNLKGNARFVPDGEDESSETTYVTETVYIHVEERRRSELEENIQELVRVAVDRLIDRGVEWAQPRISDWWHERAKPYAAAKRDNLRNKRAGRGKTSPTEVLNTDEPSASESPLSLSVRPQRPKMSEAEAKARMLAAVAARAFSEEQLRMVADADIIGGLDPAALERSLAELPAEELRVLLLAMATDPRMLTEESLANLASIIGPSTERELRDEQGFGA